MSREFYARMMEQRPSVLESWEQLRVRHTLDFLPSDVGRVLEIGCGDGRISGTLHAAGVHVVGTDISPEWMKEAKFPRISGTAGAIPVREGCIDTLIAAEVVEHLDPSELDRFREELRRLLPDYVFLSVPYRENLRSDRVRCDRCGEKFHLWGHRRTFRQRDMIRFLPGFRLARVEQVGPQSPRVSSALLFLAQVFGGAYRREGLDRSQCPQCGNENLRSLRPNLLGRAFLKMNAAWNRERPGHPRWLFVLYARRGID